VDEHERSIGGHGHAVPAGVAYRASPRMFTFWARQGGGGSPRRRQNNAAGVVNGLFCESDANMLQGKSLLRQ